MSGILEHRGYYGTVEFSEKESILFGKVLNINGLISYEGESVQGLREDFEGAVDGYLSVCAEKKIDPEKPYKGTFNVRIKPELHKRAALAAAEQGETLNSLVEQAIKTYVARDATAGRRKLKRVVK